MEKGCSSKPANLKFHLFASNGDEDLQKNKQPISKFNLPASDHDKEVPEFPSANNGPNLSLSGSLLAESTAKELEASRIQKASLDQMNANINGDSNPLPKAKLVSSPAGTTDEPLLQHGRSNEKPMQPTCPGIEGSGSSGGDATAAQQATSFTPLIMGPTQSFSLALVENIPQNGSSATQSSHSKHLGNSGQANKPNTQTGRSIRAELQQPQRVEPLDKGKKILFADGVEKKKGNPRSNRNQRAVHYPNLFPQSSTGIRFLNGESTQTNRPPAPTWFCNKETDLYRSLAPGSLVDQFKATNISDPLCYNLMLPSASTPPSPQQLSNPMQLLNQLAGMPNASGSLLQNSDLTKHSLPMELMAQKFSYQNNQLPWALGLYNSETGSTMFHEIFIPLSSLLLPAQDLQASNLFSMMPNLPNQDHHNSELSRLVSVQQQGFLNQTTKPTATYPSSGTSMTSLLPNSSLLHENVGSSAPNLMQTPLSNHTEQGNSEPQGNARSRLEVGESSPFKRLRRETNEPQAPSAEQIMGNSLSLPTGASASPDIGNLLPPRPIMNSLYDPMFEELGLPIDPHLRLFAKYKENLVGQNLG
ncbi:hypothetical protein E1A91_D05G308300v1 [Gossypium mustelinum]|uniref:Uncharacterized protein n=1 Tax=Gossypium mustelinum TaxID=34275 RepID=A0A5D2V2U6_GOSMU|nr:hypothetical protein E1A91_D05G308300v1 [Gossypium mustelinum]